MFRISDILKKHKKFVGKEAPKQEKPAREEPIIIPRPAMEKWPAPKAAPAVPQSAEGLQPEQKPPESAIIEPATQKTLSEEIRVNISLAVNKEMKKERAPETAKLYDEVLSKVKSIYRADLKSEKDLLKTINALTEKSIEALNSKVKDLAVMCLTDYPNVEDYFYYHIVNVFFTSIDIGLGLGYERARLIDLGAGAFLHDIGMKDMTEHDKMEPLDNYEYGRIKQHPELGVEMLKKMGTEINSVVLDIVRQEHERANGSGYPAGAKSEDINEYAQIVGLVDSYEAMTHYRPYRSKYTPLEAITVILKSKSMFGQKVIKALILRIGVFPVGTPVILNTKEIGIVVSNIPELPFRPFVRIIYDSYGRELAQAKTIDLAETPIIYIENCVKEEKPPRAAGEAKPT